MEKEHTISSPSIRFMPLERVVFPEPLSPAIPNTNTLPDFLILFMIDFINSPFLLPPSSYLYLHQMLFLIIDQVNPSVALYQAVNRHACHLTPRPFPHNRDLVYRLMISVMQAKRR